jgi:hypothetical protein
MGERWANAEALKQNPILGHCWTEERESLHLGVLHFGSLCIFYPVARDDIRLCDLCEIYIFQHSTRRISRSSNP